MNETLQTMVSVIVRDLDKESVAKGFAIYVDTKLDTDVFVGLA